MKLKQILSHVRKACEDYNMIEEGDKIGVGVSGGKDSLALLIALSDLRRFYPKKFEIEAITVSLGLFEMDFSPVDDLCKELGVNYIVEQTDIGEIVFNERKEKHPCSLCAKMRKGSLNKIAKQRGLNKIAYGHNKDDLIETFFMSLYYEGRIHAFSPILYLDRMDLTLIRPLLYVKESEISSFINNNGYVTIGSNCPVDGHTKREEIKNHVKQLNNDFGDLHNKVFGAIKRSNIDGWKKGVL